MDLYSEDEMMTSQAKPWFVAIGASGGNGLVDIESVLRELPSSLNAVVLIVLHRLWHQPSHLASILGRTSRCRCP